jgi:hypothetical protein
MTLEPRCQSSSLRLIGGALIVILGLLPLGPSLSAQELTWKLKAGEKFEVALTQKKFTQTSVDKRMVTNNSQTMIRQHWDVDSIDDKGNFRIKQIIKSIGLSIENPELPSQALLVDTDSDIEGSKESIRVLDQIRPLLGMELTVTISPRGEILGVGYSDDTQKILQELPGSLGLQSLLSAQGVNDLLGAAAVVLPKKAAQPGQSWTGTDSVINPLGEFKRIREYHVIEIENQNASQVAVIDLATTIEPGVVNPKNGKLISFQETGKLKVDLNRGMLQSSETTSVTVAATRYQEIEVKTRIETINKFVIDTR